MQLKPAEFAKTCGLFWGFGLFMLTWWIMAFEGCTNEQTMIGRVYRGYRISPKGSVLGLIWGAIDGFVGGLTFACLYNRLSAKDSDE